LPSIRVCFAIVDDDGCYAITDYTDEFFIICDICDPCDIEDTEDGCYAITGYTDDFFDICEVCDPVQPEIPDVSSSSLSSSIDILEQSISCGSLHYADCGREPIGVAQKLGHEWPLVQPSDDIRYLLADAYLNYEDPYDYAEADEPYELPFRIAYLYGVGCEDDVSHPAFAPDPVHEADILIFDAQDRVVFDSTTGDLTKQVWNECLTVYEWETADSVCRIVAHTAWQPDSELEPEQIQIRLIPESAILDPRVIRRQPKKVRKLIVNDEDLIGDIELHWGFNIEYTDVAPINQTTGLLQQVRQLANTGSNLRAGFQFTIDGTPGGGLGLYPGCDDIDPVLRRINGVTGNEYGDFLLAPEQCYWIERPSTIATTSPRTLTVTPNTLQFHNNCRPCCECDDFVEVKKAIDSLFNSWRELGQTAEEIRDLYSGNRSRWISQKECRETRPQKLILEPMCGGYIGLGYSFCNLTRECQGPLSIKVEFETHGYGGTGPVTRNMDVELVDIRTRKNERGERRLLPYNMGGEYPSYNSYWEVLDYRQSARLSLMLQACEVADGDSITVTITPTFAGVELDPITDTVAFQEVCLPEDFNPCGQSSLSIPN